MSPGHFFSSKQKFVVVFLHIYAEAAALLTQEGVVARHAMASRPTCTLISI